MPAAYVDARAELDPIDVVYEPIQYERPVVIVEEPPPAWVGLRFAVVAPAVEVHTPAVVVHKPHAHVGVEVVAPRLEVDIGLVGGVFVGGHSHGHYKGKGKGHWKGRGKGHWKGGGGGGGRRSGGVQVRDHRR